jgi:hypothetical protein
MHRSVAEHIQSLEQKRNLLSGQITEERNRTKRNQSVSAQVLCLLRLWSTCGSSSHALGASTLTIYSMSGMEHI